MDYKILNEIKSPDDVKKLNRDQIEPLCSEIRDCIVDTVSKNGGHLASNLGTVELTVALHRVFNSPTDAIVFDVGHQSYTHKLLTGRFENFSTLRKEGGISGFMRPDESEHDPIVTGHSSNSVSAAYGIYKAKSLLGEPGTAVALIGDGALTGGMVYEALNNAGTSKGNFIVVLNDNKMSISRNVGALARYLSIIRSRPKYHKFKLHFQNFLIHIPFIGRKLTIGLFNSKTMLKNAIYHSNIFEGLGYNYLGPIDGHDEKRLEDILTIAKEQSRPALVHVITSKGKGYKYAETSPKIYHGVSPFDTDIGAQKCATETFSGVFGKTMCDLAAHDDKICAITAAMASGTGLADFAELYRNRFFDVGIAEQHAVTFAAGLAKGGMHPVFAVYSSFLQRGFDQVVHDAAIANVPITICVDRAGFVGEDGETHQGLFDTAFLSEIPNVNIFAPSNFAELEDMLTRAVNSKSLSVIRYPRGSVGTLASGFAPTDENFTVVGKGKTAIVTYGRIFDNALNASRELNDTEIIKLNKIHPIDPEVYDVLSKCKRVFFFEEGVKTGGIGEQMGEQILERGLKCSFKLIAVGDSFIPAASVQVQLCNAGLDTESIIKTVKGE